MATAATGSDDARSATQDGGPGAGKTYHSTHAEAAADNPATHPEPHHRAKAAVQPDDSSTEAAVLG